LPALTPAAVSGHHSSIFLRCGSPLAAHSCPPCPVRRSSNTPTPWRCSRGRCHRPSLTRASSHHHHPTTSLPPTMSCYAKKPPSSFHHSSDFLTHPPSCRTLPRSPPTTLSSDLAGRPWSIGLCHITHRLFISLHAGPCDHVVRTPRGPRKLAG
jgi:hypothetical protein